MRGLFEVICSENIKLDSLTSFYEYALVQFAAVTPAMVIEN